MSAKMHFCAFIMATGHHIASWRYPDVPLENGTNFHYWADLARIAERGKLDAIFLYDGAAISNIPLEPMSHTDRATFFDPMNIAAGTCDGHQQDRPRLHLLTTYDQPFYVARRYLSLDHLSGGRAGWNMVTGVNVREALNFGTTPMAHDERYVRAREFAEVVRGLWDSWADDAFIMDKESGRFFDPAKVQPARPRRKILYMRPAPCVLPARRRAIR